MEGIISDINWERGMASVKTEMGDYSIFEIQSDDNIHKGDEISWDGIQPMGDHKIKNITEDEELTVYFQNHSVSIENLREQLQY